MHAGITRPTPLIRSNPTTMLPFGAADESDDEVGADAYKRSAALKQLQDSYGVSFRPDGLMYHILRTDLVEAESLVDIFMVALNNCILSAGGGSAVMPKKLADGTPTAHMIRRMLEATSRHAGAAVFSIPAVIYSFVSRDNNVVGSLNLYEFYRLGSLPDALATEVVKKAWDLISPPLRAFRDEKTWIIMCAIAALNHGHGSPAEYIFLNPLKKACRGDNDLKRKRVCKNREDEGEPEDDAADEPEKVKVKLETQNQNTVVERQKSAATVDQYARHYLDHVGIGIFKHIEQIPLISMRQFVFILNEVIGYWTASAAPKATAAEKMGDYECLTYGASLNQSRRCNALHMVGKANITYVAAACLRNGLLAELDFWAQQLKAAVFNDGMLQQQCNALAMLWSGTPFMVSPTVWQPCFRATSLESRIKMDANANQQTTSSDDAVECVSLFTSLRYLVLLWLEQKFCVDIASKRFAVDKQAFPASLVSLLSRTLLDKIMNVNLSRGSVTFKDWREVQTIQNKVFEETQMQCDLLVAYVACIDACIVMHAALRQTRQMVIELPPDLPEDCIVALVGCHAAARFTPPWVQPYLIAYLSEMAPFRSTIWRDVPGCLRRLRRAHFMPKIALMSESGMRILRRLPYALYPAYPDDIPAFMCGLSWGELAMYVRSGILVYLHALGEVDAALSLVRPEQQRDACELLGKVLERSLNTNSITNPDLVYIHMGCVAFAIRRCHLRSEKCSLKIDFMEVVWGASAFDDVDPYVAKYDPIVAKITAQCISSGYELADLQAWLNTKMAVVARGGSDLAFEIRHSAVCALVLLRCDALLHGLFDKLPRNFASNHLKYDVVRCLIHGALLSKERSERWLVLEILGMASDVLQKLCLHVLEHYGRELPNGSILTEGWLLVRAQRPNAFNHLFHGDEARASLRRAVLYGWVFKYDCIHTVHDALTLTDIRISLQTVLPERLGICCKAVAQEYGRLLVCVVESDAQQALGEIAEVLAKIQAAIRTERAVQKSKEQWASELQSYKMQHSFSRPS